MPVIASYRADERTNGFGFNNRRAVLGLLGNQRAAQILRRIALRAAGCNGKAEHHSACPA
jgi:hypothetical protein